MALVFGVGETVRRLGQVESKTTGALESGMERGVMLGASIVRGKASGRPGPRVVTGDFRRSIASDTGRAGPLVLGQIGTNKPQARRLEYGFFGRDSLGRMYAQPPYPYLLPSVPEVTAACTNEIAKALGKASL